MPFVYILSEDDFDDQIYTYLAESLLGAQVEVVGRRLRRGGGIGAVRRALPLLLADIRHLGAQESIYFIISMDNDRAFEHPEHGPAPYGDGKPCRHCGLTEAVHAAMPDGWSVPGAVAVPVQMIEAWLLLMHDAEKYREESALPPCGWRAQPLAQRLLGPDPPPQLKDLVEAERGTETKADFAMSCVAKLRPGDLATRSPSFRLFHDQVSRW